MIIVVPDETFLEKLRPLLVAALQKKQAGKGFELLRAEAALGTAGVLSCSPSLAVEHKNEVILDTLENIDGLERLAVVAVGLDAKIQSGEDSVKSAMDTRSRIYRAVTRAKLMLCVVNEPLEGGFMEWLTNLGKGAEGNDPPTDVEKFIHDSVNKQQAKQPQGVQVAADAQTSAATAQTVEVGQVISFVVDGETYVAAVVQTRAPEDDPENGLTHEIKYLSVPGVEWVKLKDGYLSDTYDHHTPFTLKNSDANVEAAVVVKAEVCNECGKSCELGWTDPADGNFYCKDCWDAFEAADGQE